MSNTNQDAKEETALDTVGYYTVAASVTGAIPVPASSAAIIAENTAMVAHISSIYNQNISMEQILKCFGVMGTVNFVGRQVFIEGARLLSWGTGQWWAQPLLSGLGATTAGVQTYIIGRLAMVIGQNDGISISLDEAEKTIRDATAGYGSFIDQWKDESPQNHD